MHIKKNLFFSCILMLLLQAPFVAESAQAAPEIRKITPPNLSASHIGKHILCYRPMRRGSPNISIDQKDGKIIAQNYGHGGSGFTLGPGSATYVNDLLINSAYSTDLQKNTPITIIGAGVIGLFSAYDLIQRGYTNITIVADKFENLTSHNAGGLLAPVSMDNAPDMQKVIDKIGIDAYQFYASIARHQHPDFKESATIVPTYFQNREDSGLEPYVGKVMSPAKDVILDFGNGTTQPMVAYDDGIFMNPFKLMDELHAYLKAKKVKFVHKKIKGFDQIKTKYIINCTGLGAGELNKDSNMIPVQGHLIMLKDQIPAQLQYMILVYFKEGKTAAGQKVKRSFYIFPKHFQDAAPNDFGVLGGTFIEGATPATPNEEEFGIMLEGAKQFYGITH